MEVEGEWGSFGHQDNNDNIRKVKGGDDDGESGGNNVAEVALCIRSSLGQCLLADPTCPFHSFVGAGLLSLMSHHRPR